MRHARACGTSRSAAFPPPGRPMQRVACPRMQGAAGWSLAELTSTLVVTIRARSTIRGAETCGKRRDKQRREVANRACNS